MWRRWLTAEVAILLLATVLRLVWLDARPAHFDEGVNGWFVDQMTRHGFFAYDPSNYHGPLHFYTLFCSLTLFGRNLWALRLPVVLIGLATVWLVLRLRPFLGVGGARIGALLVAVSPAFVFYHRYSIHEAWLVFFLVLYAFGTGEVRARNSAKGLWAVITAVMGMVVTKETYVIHLLAFACAWACLFLWERWSASTDAAPLPPRTWTMRDLAYAVSANVFAFVFFYSGNFMNWGGVADAFNTYAKWFQTGMQSGDHAKSFVYWLELFFRYEWAALIGLVACVRCLWPAPRFVRWLAISGGGALLAYSVIPYKTPWCVIAVLWPLLLVAGWWIAELLRSSLRGLTIAAMILLTVICAWESARVSIIDCTDEVEPYVYVQTYHDVDLFMEPLLAMTRIDPANYHIYGILWVESYYPLPWLLGDFTRMGYFKEKPEHMDADVILIDADKAEEVEEILTGNYYTEKFRLRAGQGAVKAYFAEQRFREYFFHQRPDFIPQSEMSN